LRVCSSQCPAIACASCRTLAASPPARPPACTGRISVIKMRPPGAISPASAFCHPPCLPSHQMPAASRSAATIADRTRRQQQCLTSRTSSGRQTPPRGRTWQGMAGHRVVTYCNVASVAIVPLWLSQAVAATLISATSSTWTVGTAANGARGAILHPGDVAGPQPHPPPQDVHFLRPGPECPVQVDIGSGWVCHRDPLFQNQPFLA